MWKVVTVSGRAARSVAVLSIAVLVTAGCGAEATSDLPSAAGGSATPSAAAPGTASPAQSPSGEPSVAPSPTAPAPLLEIDVNGPGPNEIYEFGPDVSNAERSRIQDWTAYGVRWQEVLFGRRITNFTTIASNQLRWVAEKDCETRPASMPNCVQQQIEFYEGGVLGGCRPAPEELGCFVVGWLGVEGLDEPWFRQFRYAHEVHHVLFGQLYPDAWRATMVPLDQVWGTGPVWLLEGAATWVGEHAAIDRGLISYAARRAEWEEWSDRVDVPLSRLETLAGEARVGFAYWLYALALEELLELAPDGPLSILNYYEAVANGAAWKTAFDRAFGLSVSEFYEHFDRVRP